MEKSLDPIARHIWDLKYRFKEPGGAPVDRTIDDTFARVARAAAKPEPRGQRKAIEAEFLAAMSALEFLPAGRILAGAGTGRAVTLFNCFVMGTIEDDLSSIFDHVREAALTMQQGGGIGHDFSTLRPRGALVASVGAGASGPVSFMDVWDSMCRTIMSAGQRRGAMMATLACNHPDIEEFIAAKSDPARLRNFNLSVLVSDAFIAAVKADAPWDLEFAGKVYRTVPARALWQRIMRATYDYAEPGVIFIDRINAANNLAYCETIRATNPCGEQPLPPYGACLLGSINLARLVREPFGAKAALDEARLARLARTAVRFLDNVVDVSRYPLAAQRHEARVKRRIGLGVTGLADALIQIGVGYGAPEATRLAGHWMRTLSHAAYEASSALAAEKGAFPLCDSDQLLARPNIAKLPNEIRAAIGRHGLRNGLVTSIAPTGTISLLAGNVSSGIEPVFDFRYRRRILGADGATHEQWVEDYAHRLYRERAGERAQLTPAFVRATELGPSAHLAMQAAVQEHVDSSISKTINCPADMTFADFERVYLEAYELGLKGCTTYRPNAVTGAVLLPSASEGTAERAEAGGVPTGEGAAARVSDAALSPQLPATQVPAAAASALPVPAPAGAVVYMARPLERESVLGGFTYKLRWPDSDHAIYITINDIERDGRRRPFEIFINSKNLEHYAWTVALTRMISAVFRRGGDVSFVVEELKAVFDPRGGQWMGGRYVPSLLAAIGGIIEQHMLATGFLRPGEGEAAREALSAVSAPGATAAPATPPASRASGSVEQLGAAASASETRGSRGAWPAGGGSSNSVSAGSSANPGAGPAAPALTGPACPRCGMRGFRHQEGCWLCDSCGYSRCS
jgi:ribonucleoside-diphosphate reductase alpha chain